MKASKLFFPFLLAAFASSVNAFYPVDGWWFNPEESGRGVNIEMQDDTMFVSLFHYDSSGDQAWWVSSGFYDDDLGRFQSDFVATEDGQCPGCPWVNPDVVSLTNPSVTIEFISPILATMTWAGGTTRIQRQYFAQFNIEDPRTFLLGEFHFTIGADGNYSADWLTFDELDEEGNSRLVLGSRRGTPRPVVGEYVESEAAFAVLVDHSSNDFRLYNFTMNKDRIEGDAWTFPKDSEPQGSGLPFIAHRTTSRSFVQTGTGPGPLESSSLASVSAETDAAAASRVSIQETARLLRGRLVTSNK